MTSAIYAIEAENGLVKIGFTSELRGRLSHLRANNCLSLRPLGYVVGTREQEVELHNLLASEHVRGEWFRRGRLVNYFLSMLVSWPGRLDALPRVPRAPTHIRQIVGRFGGKAALANTLNISPDAIKQWMRRNEIPGKWHLKLLRIARERGITLGPEELSLRIIARAA